MVGWKEVLSVVKWEALMVAKLVALQQLLTRSHQEINIRRENNK